VTLRHQEQSQHAGAGFFVPQPWPCRAGMASLIPAFGLDCGVFFTMNPSDDDSSEL